MLKDYEKVFLRNQLEPPAGLYDAIMARIGFEKRRLARLKLALISCVSLLSLVALVPAGQYFISEFQQSGFYQYFSLIFSDGGTFFSYWREFTLSLTESFPILAASAVLLAVIVILGSLKLAVRQAKLAFTSIKLT